MLQRHARGGGAGLSNPVVAGVEGGGSHWVCAIGRGPDDLRAQAAFAARDPAATLAQVAGFLRGHRGAVAALGVACFGPVDLDPASPTFGHVTTTPKPGWSHVDVAGPLRAALGSPTVVFDTDVNGAALGEQRWGAGRGVDPLVYVTVGTGIGGGAIVHGRPLHGLVHPEMGHVPIAREPDDGFAGACPYHGACLEGLASGPALATRWGAPPETLPAGHPAWRLEARYLARGLAAIVATISPRRIVLGGGILHAPGLLDGVRGELTRELGGYVRAPEVVAPGLGDRAGVLGALALAQAGVQ